MKPTGFLDWTYRASVPFFLLLVGGGLAGNYFKYPIFLDIDFLFGSIFSMLALQRFGLARGVLAAALISSYPYGLLHPPYTIVTLVAEVAVVGWLMSKRKVGMVLADTVYWLLLGMPLTFACYYLAMEGALSGVGFIIVKQAVNGVTNALLARLLF